MEVWRTCFLGQDTVVRYEYTDDVGVSKELRTGATHNVGELYEGGVSKGWFCEVTEVWRRLRSGR